MIELLVCETEFRLAGDVSPLRQLHAKLAPTLFARLGVDQVHR